METLRASTRAANEREQMKAERERERRERERAGILEKLEDPSGGGGGGNTEQGGIGLELGIGLGLETGSNGISSGNEAGDDPTGADVKGNGNIGGIMAPAALSSNGSADLLDNWGRYTDAAISQTSSFLRESGTPAPAAASTTVRPTSS